jgi:hypothetical protein
MTNAPENRVGGLDWEACYSCGRVLGCGPDRTMFKMMDYDDCVICGNYKPTEGPDKREIDDERKF